MSDEHNPYQAPAAEVADIAAPAPDAPPPRPWVIYGVELTGLAGLFLIIQGLYTSAPTMSLLFQARIIFWGFLGATIVRIVIGALLVWMIVGLQRRSPIGRWLSIAWLTLITGVAVVSFFTRPTAGSDPDPFAFIGSFTGLLVVAGPLILLMYYSAFSPPALAYFKLGPPVPR